MAVLRGQQGFKMAAAVVALSVAVGFLTWGVTRGVAQEQQPDPVGRYQVAVPDLVLDTTTGRLVDGTGQVLEQAIDPSGKEVGRYSVDGYVTAVTTSVGLDVLDRPVAATRLVKAYVLADTQTGRVLKKRVYYSQPLQQSDF